MNRKGIRWGLLTIFALLVFFPSSAWTNELSPEWLIRQVVNTYRSLETYEVTGHADLEVTLFNQGGKVVHGTNRFTLLLKKPNLYRIQWNKKYSTDLRNGEHVVWNAGSQAYAYSQLAGRYRKHPSDRRQLQTKAGISQGITLFIPALFFRFFPEQELEFFRLTDLKIMGKEEISGKPCYVLEGREPYRVIRYWIDVKTFFIHQQFQLYVNFNGREETLQGSEEEAKASLRAEGLEPTQERIKKFQQGLELGEKILRAQRSQVRTNNFYTQISLPALTARDFHFQVPEGIPLKEELYEPNPKRFHKLEQLIDEH